MAAAIFGVICWKLVVERWRPPADPGPALVAAVDAHHVRRDDRGLVGVGRGLAVHHRHVRPGPRLLRRHRPAGGQPRQDPAVPAGLLGGRAVRVRCRCAGAVPGHPLGRLRWRPQLLRAAPGVDDPVDRVLPAQRDGPGQAPVVHAGPAVRAGRCRRCREPVGPDRRGRGHRRHHGHPAPHLRRTAVPGRHRGRRPGRAGVRDRLRGQPQQPPAGLRRPRCRAAWTSGPSPSTSSRTGPIVGPRRRPAEVQDPPQPADHARGPAGPGHARRTCRRTTPGSTSPATSGSPG